jgi:hypothetical protein
VTVVSYELHDHPAALVVDLAKAAAGWRVVDQTVAVADVLKIAPADDVERLVRRAVTEIRAHATTVRAPSSDLLRRLAAEVWRDYRRARAGATEQPQLPGI